eukprot:COSAG02_NODE_8488_length_2552_cov_4.203832_3_plen_182_part_00
MEEPDCDVVQIVDDYCLCRRFAESSGVLQTALEKDIGVVQAAPMYRGMLYNTGIKAAQNPEVTAMIAEMGEWARARNHDLPDLAVQFPARHSAISTCIMGAQSADEVDGEYFCLWQRAHSTQSRSNVAHSRGKLVWWTTVVKVLLATQRSLLRRRHGTISSVTSHCGTSTARNSMHCQLNC